jgi:hypothetical protein
MSEKLVLPKFHIPRRGPHWMVMALCGVAGLVVIQIGIFAVIAWRRQGDQAIAVREPARAPGTEQTAQVVPAVTTPVTAPVPTARPTMTGGMPPPTAVPTKKVASHHRIRSHASGRGGKTLAKTGVAKRESPPAKSDELDDLLRKFK